jgi:hypothetical protein
VTVGAVTEEAMLDYLKVDQGLQALGLQLSRREAYKRYSRAAPEADDVLEAPAPAAQGQQQPGGGAGASPFSEGLRAFCNEGQNAGKPGPCPEGQDRAGLGVTVPYNTPIHAQVDRTLERARQRLAQAGDDPLKAGAVRLQAAEQLERGVHNRVVSLLLKFKQQYPGLETGREFKEAARAGRELKSAAWVLGHTLGTGEEPGLQAEYRQKLAEYQAKVAGLSRKARIGLSEGEPGPSQASAGSPAS